MTKILVVAEQREGTIKELSFEVATLARQLSDHVSALVIGSGIGDAATKLADYGIADIQVADKAEFANYSPDGYAKTIQSVVDANGVDVVMMGASALGKDLSGRVGALIGAGVAQDCIKIDTDFTATRPMYAGKVWTTVNLHTDKKVFTLRPNSVKAETDSATANVSTVDVATDFKTIVKELLTSAGEKLDVAEANIIVTGGRGMGGPENWNLIEDLAATLGAATGASRAVVDAGWRPHSEQVGQTGKTVSPSLYIACGVSGAIQHLAGMKTSKYIVAVNKDPEAPIFKVADYGIVGDVMDVLPALNTALKDVVGK